MSKYIIKGHIAKVINTFSLEDIPTKLIYVNDEKVGFYQSGWYSKEKKLSISTSNEELRKLGVQNWDGDLYDIEFSDDKDLLSFIFGGLKISSVVAVESFQELPDLTLTLDNAEAKKRGLEILKETTLALMEDKVNSPSHYNHGEIECIDAITAALTPDELKGFVRGNVIKYLWRMEHKGGLEDLKKAQWYLDYLIKKLEGTGLDWYSPVAKKPSAGDKVLFILKGKELVSKNAIAGYFCPNLFKAYSGEYWGVEDVEMWAKAK